MRRRVEEKVATEGEEERSASERANRVVRECGG